MEGTSDDVEQERREGMTTEQDSGSGLVSGLLVTERVDRPQVHTETEQF